jgi:hypothetical protein
VRGITPKKHHALLDYIERARRKRLNKAKRDKLMQLLGKSEDAAGVKATDDSDSDDEMDSAD